MHLSKFRIRRTSVCRIVLLLMETFVEDYDSIVDYYFAIDAGEYILKVYYRQKKSVPKDEKVVCSYHAAVFYIDYKYIEPWGDISKCIKYILMNELKGVANEEAH